MAKKLYVGNLSYNTTQEALTELFGTVGAVQSVALITDRESGRSKGFAFVEMDDEGATNAISQLNGKDVDGRKISVAEARPREEGGSGGRGSGGGYRGGGGRGGSGGRGRPVGTHGGPRGGGRGRDDDSEGGYDRNKRSKDGGLRGRW